MAGPAEINTTVERGLHELVPCFGVVIGTQLVAAATPDRGHAAAIETFARVTR